MNLCIWNIWKSILDDIDDHIHIDPTTSFSSFGKMCSTAHCQLH